MLEDDDQKDLQILQDEQYLDKMHTVSAVAGTEAGIGFLQWLVRLSGFNRPVMSMEDASRRDVWLTIRPFVPVEKLSEIEHLEIREHQRARNEELYRAQMRLAEITARENE